MRTMKRVWMLASTTLMVAGPAVAQIRTPRIEVEVPAVTVAPMTFGSMTIEPITVPPMVIMVPPMEFPIDLASGADLAGLSELSRLGDLATLGELDPHSFRSRALAPLPRVKVPREAWVQGDPADSLYRAAREALNRSDYRVASSLFAQIRQRYPQSKYGPDALYWDAYARWKQGGEDRLRTALDLLADQRKLYPQAATASGAVELETRIRGELARRGDSQEAERIAEIAGGAGSSPQDPPDTPEPALAPGVRARPRAPRVVVTPRPPRLPRAPRLAGESDDLPENCSREDYEEKVAALNALLQMNSDRGLPILKQLLARRDECSTPLRRKAVFLVAQQKSSESADILLHTVKTDPDPEVRRQGVFWLGQVDGDRPVELLGDILRTSDDVEMQKRALFALSQHEGGKAAEMVRTYAEREDVPEELQKQAIFYIGQHETAENAAFLRALYGRLKSAEAKERVLFSVSQMRGDGSGRWLLEVASNVKEPVELRKKALFWAGQQNGADIATFTALYEKMPDRDMKEQLIFLYSQRREPAAVDKLLEIAQKETDRDLRKKAIFWLTQSNDPRVTKFLEDIINR